MFHVFFGEFLGTLVMITLGCGVNANVCLEKSKGYQSGWLVITTGWFAGVIIGIFVAQSTGAPNSDINPIVSLTKCVLGRYSLLELLGIWLAQFSGAFVGAIIVWLAYLPHWKETSSQQIKLGIFCTAPAIRNYPANLLCEVIGTVILIVGVAAIFGHATQGSVAVGLGPYLVGILVLAIGLSLGGPTGFAINPARDLGPRIAHAILPIPGKGCSDWPYAFVPIVGPLLGGLIGVLLWWLFF